MRFVKAAGFDDIEEGAALRVVVENRPLALVKAGGALYALDDTCTHENESLSGGFIEFSRGLTIECPRHGATFDLKTGKALSLPAIKDLETYAVKVENGDIFIGIDKSLE